MYGKFRLTGGWIRILILWGCIKLFRGQSKFGSFYGEGFGGFGGLWLFIIVGKLNKFYKKWILLFVIVKTKGGRREKVTLLLEVF